MSITLVEISFSKLNIIKNYLRSTMSQERLNRLASVAIEITTGRRTKNKI